MADLPLHGSTSGNSFRNPILIPDFDQPVAANGVVGLMSPSQLVASNPRVAATESFVVGGTIATGDTISLEIANGVLPNGSVTVSYTTVAGDTLTSIAAELVNAVNTNATLQAYGIIAENGGEAAPDEVILAHPGTVGNFTTFTASSTGSETFTPATGALTGGSGPIIAVNNFNFSYNGSTMSFFYGHVYNLAYSLIQLMVEQGMPIA